MKNILLIALLCMSMFFCQVVLFGCSPQSKIGNSYRAGSDILNFDKANKRFVLVERGELGFYNYSEGSYSQNKKTIFLTGNSFDSCIKYRIVTNDHPGSLKIQCMNYDPRVNIIYTVNKKKYNSSGQGELSLDYDESVSPEIEIDLPFPDKYNVMCNKKLEVLHTTIKLAGSNFNKRGISVIFTVNYNYFNWGARMDTVMILNSKSIRLNNAEYLYKKVRKTEDDINVNYLSRCLAPYKKT